MLVRLINSIVLWLGFRVLKCLSLFHLLAAFVQVPADLKRFKGFLILVLSLLFTPAFTQLTTIEGYVREAGTRDPVIFAHIYIKSLQVGTTSDTSGYYKLQFELKGRRADSIVFSYLVIFPSELHFNLMCRNGLM